MVRETVEILIEKIKIEARPQKSGVDGPLILRKSQPKFIRINNERLCRKWKGYQTILGITKEIWEDGGIDTLNNYYTKDIPMRFPEGISIGNPNTINGTLALSEFPDRQLTGEDVIWSGDDQTGFLSSHRLLTMNPLR